MAQTKDRKDGFVVIRIRESTRLRLKVKAARSQKKLWEIADDMSKNECLS